jgi:two-component system NarL family sensor kinase
MEAEAPLILLTGLTAYGYATSGLAALVVLAGVQLWFIRSARELHRSVERADRISELSASRNRLVEQILTAEESERRRLADALHDGAVQNLLAARQDLAEAVDTPRLLSAKCAIDATVEQLREEISELHPSVLAHVGLTAALESVATVQARRGGFEATVEVDGSFPPPLEALTFTVCRELLVNAAKHSRARRVTVRVKELDGHVAIETADDGCGFPERSFKAALDRGHIGLASIAERVEALGGRIEVDSRPGTGTRVAAIVPVASAATATRTRPELPTVPAAHLRTEMPV